MFAICNIPPHPHTHPTREGEMCPIYIRSVQVPDAIVGVEPKKINTLSMDI
jgi:hypothetical protein